jgi:hypothetical protein
MTILTNGSCKIHHHNLHSIRTEKCTTPGHRCLNISTRTREQRRSSTQDKTGCKQLNLCAINLQLCSTTRESRADKSAISHEIQAIHRQGAEPRRGCSCDMFWHVLSTLMHFQAFWKHFAGCSHWHLQYVAIGTFVALMWLHPAKVRHLRGNNSGRAGLL